jgi:hypothetical protein
MADASPESETVSEGNESIPAVERQWRPAHGASERPSSQSEEDAGLSPSAPAEASSNAVPSNGDGGGRGLEEGESPIDAMADDPLVPDEAPEELPESPPEDGTLGSETVRDPSPSQDLDRTREAGKQVNEEAFADTDDGSWTDQVRERPDPSADQNQRDEDFFTDTHRHVPGAEQVEEELQDFAYDINEGTADTDWTPSEREDRRIASMFARLVSKVAEDMSYQRAPGDEFWDPRKIMRRQIDRRPLRHCKMDYTKRRLALLVDTSPSCRDEAVFYSKIATGALLRDDIDIFLCPNGRIDARFDPEPMRFVDDDRGSEWALDGRVVLYFTDWDGTDELVRHSRDCTLYWFDNCSPSDYWESQKERRRRVRLRYRGRHFHCPDPDAFRRLARKIRP